MIYEINGVKLGVVRTADFLEFMVNHIFFSFMATGRPGLNQGVTDLVDCLIRMFVERGSIHPGQLNVDEYNAIVRDALKLVMDGFILEGTAGIYNATFKMYNYVGQLPKPQVKPAVKSKK